MQYGFLESIKETIVIFNLTENKLSWASNNKKITTTIKELF